MEIFVQQLINGLTLGSIYGLIVIGYTMVYGIIGMINFAHGDVFMLSAFIALILFLLLTQVLGVLSLGVALLIVAPTRLYGRGFTLGVSSGFSAFAFSTEAFSLDSFPTPTFNTC